MPLAREASGAVLSVLKLTHRKVPLEKDDFFIRDVKQTGRGLNQSNANIQLLGYITGRAVHSGDALNNKQISMLHVSYRHMYSV